MKDYQKPAFQYLHLGLLLLLLLLISLLACQPGAQQGASANNIVSKPLEPAQAPTRTQGIVTYLSGDVYIAKGQDWEWIDIGALVTMNDIIKTGEDAFCEINLRDTALIRIKGNTVVKLLDIFAAAGKNKNTLEVISGSVLCKVNKLIDDESFSVVIPGVICGVRGTEFLVQAKETGFLVAVKEGKVALMPKAVYAQGANQKTADKSLTLNKTVKNAFETNAPLVNKDEEVVVSNEVTQTLEKTLTDIKTRIDNLSESNETVKTETTATLEKQITASAVQWQELIKNKQKLSAASDQALTSFTETQLLALPEAGETVKYKKLSIRSNVQGAEIYFNDKLAGKTIVAGMFDVQQPLAVLVTKEGFESCKLVIDPRQATDQEYLIALKALKTDSSKSEKNNEQTNNNTTNTTSTEPGAQHVALKIKTNPGDAQIIINGQVVDKGSYSAAYKTGEKLEIKVQRSGYVEKTLTLTVAKDTKGTQEINLEEKPLIENQFFVSFAELVGALSIPDKNHVIAADKFGVLISTDLKGKKLWSLSTNNQPNENSSPVLIGQQVYFSGSTEFLVLDAPTGKGLAKKNLDATNAHLFGSRVIAYNNRGVYPANDKLVYFDLNTGAFQEEITIPEGLQMTPTVYKDQFLLLNQAGELIFIDAPTGKINKRVPTAASQSSAASITIKEDKAFFAGRKGPVICFDLAQSKVVWEKAFPAEKRAVFFHDLICSDDEVFIYSSNQLLALSAKNGIDLYPALTGVSAPPLYTAGLLFIGSMGGGLTVYRAKTGELVREIKFKERVTTRPVLDNNRIYVGTATGMVLVINPESFQ